MVQAGLGGRGSEISRLSLLERHCFASRKTQGEVLSGGDGTGSAEWPPSLSPSSEDREYHQFEPKNHNHALRGANIR